MIRRFDNDLMQPPTLGATVDAALLRTIRNWCEDGAASIDFASIASHAGLDAVACEIDGSHALARLGRWRGLAWRLQVVVNDHRPNRTARRDDPWDCGWWREGPVSIASAFRPRRATLLMVRVTEAAVVGHLVEALTAGSASYLKPLRVLMVATTPPIGLPRLQGSGSTGGVESR